MGPSVWCMSSLCGLWVKRVQAGWFLRPDCAPSSECPWASIAVCRHAAGSIRISRWPSCCCSSAIAGIAIGENFKIYLLRQFCSNRVEFFYSTQETQPQKMMDQNFEIRILRFSRIFLNFQRRRTVPLRLMWTIMVAAKLGQSRVLVTKFRQNRLTLKSRSAVQRNTDRQTRLKIMALQVCNRANSKTDVKLQLTN